LRVKFWLDLFAIVMRWPRAVGLGEWWNRSSVSGHLSFGPRFMARTSQSHILKPDPENPSSTIGGEDNEGYSCIQRINTFESTRAYQLNVYRIHSQTQHYSQLKQFAEQLIMPVSHYTD